MSRGSQENARVRKEITEALFVLLKTKEFSEITVTDLVAQANVARVSYYRNFETREAIVEEFMDSVYRELIATLGEPESGLMRSFDSLARGFEASLSCLLKKKAYVIALYDNGFGSLVLETMNRYVEEISGDMPGTSMERYKLYFATGAAFNVLIKWLEGGAIESPREMARACAAFLKGGIFD